MTMISNQDIPHKQLFNYKELYGDRGTNIENLKEKKHVHRVAIDMREPIKKTLNAQQHLLERLEKLKNKDDDLMFLIGSFRSERDKLDEIYTRQNFYDDDEQE